MKIISKITIVISFFILTNIQIFSQDTINLPDTVAVNQTIKTLDSLLNTYYVKTSLKNYSNQNKDIFIDDHKINISDSVIIERLKKISSPIPLTFNPIVRRWINLYLKKGKYLIPTVMGLSEYYFPMFEEELAANNMPLELKYLPVIESALNPRAVSRVGATGLWQFMYLTGSRYGLEINSFVDERRDPLKSTKAAVKYLKNLHDIFGDWTLAMAAYNCGPGNVKKAIVRSGGKTDFWEIYNYLPRETRGYIPAYIAVTYILNYPKEHNFYPAKIDLPDNTDTVSVKDTLLFTQVSKVIGIPIEQLRDLNPQYIHDYIPGYKKTYTLRLPTSYITNYLLNEEKIYNYKDSTIKFQKFKVKNPPHITYRNYYKPKPCPKYNFKNKTKLFYTVKEGDVLSLIADLYDVNVSDIKCWNKKTSSRIYPGQKLVIYVPSTKAWKYKKINTMSKSKKMELLNSNTPKPANLDKNYVYYKVRSGDNLYYIAKRFSDVTYQDLLKINNFTEADAKRLKPGQYIKIKKKN